MSKKKAEQLPLQSVIVGKYQGAGAIITGRLEVHDPPISMEEFLRMGDKYDESESKVFAALEDKQYKF